MSNKLRAGEYAQLGYGYDSPPCGRTIEVLAEPDQYGMVKVRFTESFYVSVEDVEKP